MTAIAHALTDAELDSLRADLTELNLPVSVDMDGETCVVHVDCGCGTRDEVAALRLVEARTDAFRCDLRGVPR